MDGFALIDYDNLTASFRGMSLASLSMRIRATADKLTPSLDDLYVRLYGGWYGATGLTASGTRLAQEIQSQFPIPQVKNKVIVRTHCDIASALIDAKGDILPHTYRKRPGLRSRVAFSPTSKCKNNAACTATMVVQWSKGTCPQAGCSASAADVFTYHEQKLVDTLLCCDLIALAIRIPSPPIFVVSDDDDMTPALLMAGRNGAAVFQLQMRNLASRPYAQLLSRNNIATIAL